MSDESANYPLAHSPRRDFRFVVTNQTPYCWTRYNEYLLCASKRGPTDAVCVGFKRDALNLCTFKMIEKWEEQRANGNFTGIQYDGPGVLKLEEEE
jgi:cytochrome c oxidase subunit 6b